MNIFNDEDLIAFMGVQESQNIEDFGSFADGVVARFANGSEMAGVNLPWRKLHGQFAIRPGEVTIWAGINGHGKSQVLGQVCAAACTESKWLIASLEMPVEATIERMIKQMSGMSNPSESYIRQLMEFGSDNIFIYDQLDTIPAERIIAMVHYAATVLKVDNIIIDSLMKCGVGSDDYEGQKKFIDKLCWAAKTHKVHIHLVHHMRKGEREGKVPDKFDVKGAGELTDMVDNLIIIHRNKDKEKAVREGKEVSAGIPDATLVVAKQRHAGIEGSYGLYFLPESQQFVESPNAGPMRFNI